MTRKFNPHTDRLPPAQRRLWPELRNASSLGLTLYGGTAIALRLGHRDSIDFDFFSDKPLNRETIEAVKAIRDLPDVTLISTCLSTPGLDNL